MNRFVVGGIGHLYQGDLDFGRVVIDELARDDFGDEVVVEDFSYGAVAVAQRLEELRPDALVLVGAATRGREPGTVERRTLAPPTLATEVVQAAIADAVTGYISLDLVVDVAGGLGVLPPRTVVIEIEPATTEPSEMLSDEAAGALDEALRLARAEITAFRDASRG